MFSRNPFLELWYIYNFYNILYKSAGLFPHLHNSVSRSSHDEALSCLEGGNICDDVMMSHGKRLWAPSRGVITWSYLLLILNFLLEIQSQNKGLKLNLCAFYLMTYSCG